MQEEHGICVFKHLSLQTDMRCSVRFTLAHAVLVRTAQPPSETTGLPHRSRPDSAITLAYHKLLRSCHLHQVQFFHQSQPSDRVSTTLRFLLALEQRFGYGTHQRLMQSPDYQTCRTLSARMSSAALTYATLSSDRKPNHCPPYLSISVTSTPVSQYKHRYSRDHRSRYPTSRVSHLRPHEPLASTCSWLEWMSIDERRTNKQTMLAPTISGHAEQPRISSGMKSGFC